MLWVVVVFLGGEVVLSPLGGLVHIAHISSRFAIFALVTEGSESWEAASIAG